MWCADLRCDYVMHVCCQQEPHHRRLAFDLGDVGIGQLTNSLELGCDCLGHIHYFDAVLNNSKGEGPMLSTIIPLVSAQDPVLNRFPKPVICRTVRQTVECMRDHSKPTLSP